MVDIRKPDHFEIKLTCFFLCLWHQAIEVSHQIGALTYVETCAFNPLTARETFEVAALAASGKFANRPTLMGAKHYSLSSSSTTSSPISSTGSTTSTSDNSTSNKLKSSTSSTLLTRHRSMFKLRKCKSKSEMKMDAKKSCAIMQCCYHFLLHRGERDAHLVTLGNWRIILTNTMQFNINNLERQRKTIHFYPKSFQNPKIVDFHFLQTQSFCHFLIFSVIVE